MAGNNYFGFTHGATQYTPTGTNAYQAGQANYAVAHPAAAGNTYAAQRAGGPTYDPTYHASAQQSATYVAAAAAAAGSSNAPYDYGYARSAAAAYDGTKSYYQQPAVPATFTSSETHYQAKPSYNNTANYTGNQRNASNIPNKPYAGYGAPSYSNIPSNIKTPGKANVPTLYTAQPTGPVAASKTGSWQQNYKRGNTQNKMKPKAPPKPQQLHYCDICKISCAGPQTYREHLEGQKHKKKEAGLKGGSTTSTPRGGNSLRCELCDVTCTGSDAYAAHIRGAKHQKVVKLHTKLGKPIPSTEPVVVTPASKTNSPTVTPGTNSVCTSPGSSTAKKPTGVPKINFVGGAKLSINVKEEKTGEKLAVEEEKLLLNNSIEMKLSDEKEIQPVGLDYIEEIRNEEGKIVSFNCKLCECRFNDPNAKEMHMKGRRHRLQYKKKVNPDLVVEVKPSLRQRKLQEEKFRRQALREELWRLYSRYSGPMQPPLNRPFPPSPMMGPPPVRRPDTSDDRHVIAKHGEIYPKEGGLSAIQTIVSNTEKALKLVSDFLADQVNKVDDTPVVTETPDIKPDNDAVTVPSVTTEPSTKENNVETKKESELSPRILKGVMRVGILAKGLLLHNDSEVQLVVLCSEKPGLSLLSKVAECLPEQLSVVAPENSYETVLATEQAAVIVKSSQEPRISVTVTLTSPVMREQNLEAGDSQAAADVKDPPDVLDKHKCLEALAALRHAKWFQARANGLQSCVMVIRILRDLCQRVPTWAPLNTWAMELLCERVISSAGQPLSPGDALRRVFEALAAGILLPGSPGLQDPCEKEPVDAAAYLSSQDREDITASSQFALRLIAFRQIHKVLGMEPLPLPKFGRGRFTRKRRRDNSVGEGNDSEGRDASEAGDGKKDKKDEQIIDKMETDLVKDKTDVVEDAKLEIVK